MQDLKYYVLWKKDNQMLSWYRDRYFVQLVDKIKSFPDSDIKNKLTRLLENKDFILYCDNSSRIEYMYYYYMYNESLYGHEHIVKSFESDIDYFLENKQLYKRNGDKIWDTYILLDEFDRNPYNGMETHPDHINKSTSVWFADTPKEKWLSIYSQAFDTLKNIDEGIYDELNYIIQKIVPLGTDPRIHNSASYKEAIGHLYMWLTVSEKLSESFQVIQCLEAVIHESSHNKLNLVNKFDKLLLNGYELEYYSPYRPDIRHVWWVFLGIHAFVPTIYTLLRYYRKFHVSDNHLLEKILTYNIKNNLSLKILNRHAYFTEIGKEIMQEVEYVMKLTNQLLKEMNIDESILTHAKQKAVEHFQEVKRNYSFIKH